MVHRQWLKSATLISSQSAWKLNCFWVRCERVNGNTRLRDIGKWILRAGAQNLSSYKRHKNHTNTELLTSSSRVNRSKPSVTYHQSPADNSFLLKPRIDPTQQTCRSHLLQIVQIGSRNKEDQLITVLKYPTWFIIYRLIYDYITSECNQKRSGGFAKLLFARFEQTNIAVYTANSIWYLEKFAFLLSVCIRFICYLYDLYLLIYL